MKCGWKRIRGLSAAVLGLGLALWLVGWLLRPQLDDRPFPYTSREIEEVVRDRDVSFDPANAPNLHVDVDYAEGPNAPWWPKGESPILTQLVAEGALPPVQERVGPEPIVMRGVEGIGRYGGTWHRLAISVEDTSVINWRLAGAGLVRWSPLGYPIRPHLARSITARNDNREFIIQLRRGIRWSDGHPFTADDILYWWEHEELDSRVGPGVPPRWMHVGAEVGRLERIDEYTIRFVFTRPHGQFMETMASMSRILCQSPRHYLSRYHPRLGDLQFIEQEMRAYRLPSPRALYAYMRHFQNPQHPRLWPWIYRGYRANPPQVFVRNPYYYVVDEQGNQLPYIDRVQFAVRGNQMLAMSFANGEASMQVRHVRFDNYTELMSRREVAGTRILHWYPGSCSNWVINPNLNRRVDPQQPQSVWKARLLADKRFRQALSLALDRQAIIRGEYSNQATAGQVEPGAQSPFYSPKLAKAFIEHDPDRASRLLDELGLTRRDNEGMRTFPDGTSMVFYLDYSNFTGAGPAPFVVDDWAKVGVRVIAREQSRSLFYIRKDAADFDFNIWTSESDNFPLLDPRYFVPINAEAFYATRWGRWYANGGFHNRPRARSLKNAEGPPRDHPMYRSYEFFEQALEATSPEEQRRLFGQVLDIAAENLWTINIAHSPPQPVVVKTDFRNVPRNAIVSAVMNTPANAGIETYFFANPTDSAGAQAETVQALRRAMPRPRLSATGSDQDADAGTGGSVGWLLRWSAAGIAVLLVVLAGMRHPFVLRRLALMVPTLAVISVVVFTIIELPPGDFLASKLIQYQEAGDEAALRQIEELRTMFHFDEPGWQRYLRWMGFYWFQSFRAQDTGLLQGNMGRSMESSQSVNNLVGDRIELTVLLSLGTILFTWAMALPIGIYSAVRQYSAGDYVLTFLGFVGMSMPGFLLALVLMSLAGLGSGLFSPHFAAQPEWTWDKVVDLLKHLWVPVVVLGVGGTAGMIRVMRANLLDELRKPYVTTARAKGVRPVKLLLKYPVRVALNPFVSGIGHLFPQLVSGGAIVSIVLSLPMVGPLLLTALFSQDMYLAGSMLMVLSLLSVLGTLVSDLLLLWLDPRIRYQGGAK